jgi:hypothetical protein
MQPSPCDDVEAISLSFGRLNRAARGATGPAQRSTVSHRRPPCLDAAHKINSEPERIFRACTGGRSVRASFPFPLVELVGGLLEMRRATAKRLTIGPRHLHDGQKTEPGRRDWRTARSVIALTGANYRAGEGASP